MKTSRLLALALVLGLLAFLAGKSHAQQQSLYIKWYKYQDNGSTTTVWGELTNPTSFDVAAGIQLHYIASDNNGQKVAEKIYTVPTSIGGGTDQDFTFDVPDNGNTANTVLFIVQ